MTARTFNISDHDIGALDPGNILTSIASSLSLAGEIAGVAVEYSINQNAMNAISENALDRYVAEREAYEQNRNYKIKNG